MIPNYSELVPAYGRDYKNAKSAKADFLAGKDWQLASVFSGGSYCGISDFSPGQAVLLRFDSCRKVCPVKVPAL
jgi:hypothetical protein